MAYFDPKWPKMGLIYFAEKSPESRKWLSLTKIGLEKPI